MTRPFDLLSGGAGEVRGKGVVPASGVSARLIVFAAAAMSFLAVFALALSLAAGRLAARWEGQLAQTSTIRIVAAPAERDAQTATVLKILESTAGVSFARALDAAEQQALLAPWFGTTLNLEVLPVPQLIEVISEDEGFDADGLRLRLAAEVPDATLDDHSAWRMPLVLAANRLKALGAICILLLTASTAVMVTLAANASLAANAQVIGVLRLVGATDQFIASAFVRRFTARALAGAVVGAGLGTAAVALLPPASNMSGFLTGLGFQGAQWALPVLIPALAACVAYLATGLSARRALREAA